MNFNSTYPGPPLGTSFWDQFLAGKHQKLSKGALGANITKFEGGARAEKNAIFWSNIFQKSSKRHF